MGAKGGNKKKAGKEKKAKAGKKGKKGKKKKDDVPEGPAEQPPMLTGPSEVTTTLLGHVANYDNLWLDRDESNNFAQEYDVDLAKDCVRPNIEDEIMKKVDEMLIMQLAKIKLQLE